VRCSDDGLLVAAQVVDHKVPHRGDTVLFWEHTNWQSLCKRCHDMKTATEDGGFGR
jgi:5-methylcytosine-specific restriction protein A